MTKFPWAFTLFHTRLVFFNFYYVTAATLVIALVLYFIFHYIIFLFIHLLLLVSFVMMPPLLNIARQFAIFPRIGSWFISDGMAVECRFTSSLVKETVIYSVCGVVDRSNINSDRYIIAHDKVWWLKANGDIKYQDSTLVFGHWLPLNKAERVEHILRNF